MDPILNAGAGIGAGGVQNGSTQAIDQFQQTAQDLQAQSQAFQDFNNQMTEIETQTSMNSMINRMTREFATEIKQS